MKVSNLLSVRWWWVCSWGFGFVLLICLFSTEEYWRGKRAWENYKHEREAHGERFDLAYFIPKPVADDQNFGAIPLLACLYDYETISDKRHVAARAHNVQRLPDQRDRALFDHVVRAAVSLHWCALLVLVVL